jgi:aminoglycoside phosphotransferase (APT) family kinase protein
MSEWAAELVVDERLAGELIHEQFAPLPRRSLERLAEGWDYVAYVVDGEWVFRFPRREVVVPGTEREIAVLPRLAAMLPVAVPAPVYVGRAGDRFPWPFYGASFLPGAELAEAGLDDGDGISLARSLARALRALHSRDVLAAVGDSLPADPLGRADMSARVPRTRDALEAIADVWRPPPVVGEILAAATRLSPAEPTAVVHGDLHIRQLLADRGELSAIIDWVDLCRSDPGVDLQLWWSLLPPAGREAFFDEYGPVSNESLLRARVLALFLNAILVRHARAEGLPAVEKKALAGLERTVAD